MNWLEGLSTRPRLGLAVMIGVFVTLAGLAVLQYRWIGEVSNAERARLRARLDSSIDRFRSDVDSEIGLLIRTVTMGFTPGRRPPENPGFGAGAGVPGSGRWTPELIEERIQRWAQVTKYPKMLKWAYLAGNDGSVIRINATESFSDAELPQRFKKHLDLKDTEDVEIPAGPPMMLVEEESPALIVRRRNGPWRYAVLEFDLDYLRKDLFPALVASHFGNEYAVSIVQRNGEPLYQSAAASGLLKPEQADGEAGLFRLPPMRGTGGGGPPGFFRKGGESRRPELPSAWKLLVKYRSGSLEATVNQTRIRNLFVSGGVLFILLISLSVLMQSARRAQQLANMQMGFLTSVSHELRTPVAVICAAAENLADGLVKEKEQVQKYGTLMRQEGSRLREMVEDILSFSRLESGGVRLQRGDVPVDRIFDSALSAMQTHLSASGCTVERDIAPALPPADGDEKMLVQCLTNLMGNAVKHAAPLRWLGLRASRSGPEIVVEVEDHGPGIPNEDLEHVFDAFYRGSGALTEQVHGTGLGLSIVRRIVEAHGGKVEVKSRIGEGTCFTLRIPAKVEA